MTSKTQALTGMARTHALSTLMLAYGLGDEVPESFAGVLSFLQDLSFKGVVEVYRWGWDAASASDSEVKSRAAMAVLWCCILPVNEGQAHAVLQAVADHAAAAMVAHRETVRVTGRERLG